jgi:hypothetical protein
MEVSREEMIDFAKRETFHLDDRLVPFDRETLRAEAWLQGYEFAKRHQPKPKEGLYDQFAQQYEDCINAKWFNSEDKLPNEGEKVRIRILTNERRIDETATFKINEPTGEPAFFWKTGFIKVSSCVLWRRFEPCEQTEDKE